ncbi:hypothetical protein A9G22_02575 [Gilliamella sp. App2-1]|uniref:hypothetical protein n=1 Tax=Gilliamella sp. App2-1 TaxID=3120230 RepID=UPI00082771C6|nr:hypothetical protein [Gilliamella apicola]OCG25106.1 hypothetical protein A9G22_02980 [Gilliamella apicola]OCG25631.1 hypothetical protein A9G22_02575 [Gilliamella apicola]
MITELNNQNNFNNYRYLLVDNLVALNSINPLSHDSLVNQFGEDKLFGEQKLTQVLRTDLDYDPSICPTLIKLAEPHEFLDSPILDEIGKQAEIECFWSKRYICAYIVSPLKPAILAKQLITIGNNIAKILQQPYYPFFEPFRMQFFHEVATDQDTAWLKSQFAQIENYYYPSIQAGQFIRFTADSELETPDRWSTQYCQRLKKLRMIRTLVKAWANNRTQFDEQKNLPFHNQVILHSTQLVEQAYQLGLTEATDILFWGLNGLRYQTAFTQHPNVLEQIAKAQKVPSTLSKQVIDAHINLESPSLSINE